MAFTVLKSYVSQAAFLLEPSRENPFPGPCQLLEATAFLGLCAPFPIFKFRSMAFFKFF